MDIPERIAEIEAAAKRQGLPIATIIRHAMINKANWARWKKQETSPITRTWTRVEEAVADLIEDAQ